MRRRAEKPESSKPTVTQDARRQTSFVVPRQTCGLQMQICSGRCSVGAPAEQRKHVIKHKSSTKVATKGETANGSALCFSFQMCGVVGVGVSLYKSFKVSIAFSTGVGGGRSWNTKRASTEGDSEDGETLQDGLEVPKMV